MCKKETNFNCQRALQKRKLFAGGINLLEVAAEAGSYI